MTITTQDINRLIHEPSPKVRSYIAAKVSESFNRSHFTPNENKLAIEIFRLLLRDTSVSVRRAIAENLKHNPHVPRDIILALAHDEASIAEPVLECSELLTDEDLMELIRATREVRKWQAISRRSQLSGKVSRQLVATRQSEVVVSLLGNSGADINESDLQYIVNEFRHEQDVLAALVYRGGLSPSFAEKLFYLVSGQLKKQLTKRYRLPWSTVNQAMDAVRDAAILRFLSPWMTNEDMLQLMQQMQRNKRLSNSLVIRALCHGELRFFEAALAVKAHIPLSNAHKLLAKGGVEGFRRLYGLSGMPTPYMEPLAIILQFVQTQVRTAHPAGEGLTVAVLDYVRSQGYDRTIAHMSAIVNLISPSGHEPRILH